MGYKFETKEEYLQFIASLMVDLRGDWSHSYSDRIYTLKETLENMKDDYPEMKNEIEQDIEVCNGQLDPWNEEIGHDCVDGRYFRDCCNFYNCNYSEGRTNSVAQALLTACNNPEDNWYDDNAR